MRTAGLVLAAGAGRRFGGPKALVEIAGERLVDRAVRAARDGGCAGVIVVAGAVPLTVAGARVVDNPSWAEGMGSSLRAGLAAASSYDAVLVLLVDQPWVGTACVRRVLDAAVDLASIVVATYEGRTGHPVLLGAAHHAGVAALAAGDEGARSYLRLHISEVCRVDCGDVGDPADIDVPGDLEQRRS